MTEAQYDAEVKRYQAELEAWAERGRRETEQRRDVPSGTAAAD